MIRKIKWKNHNILGNLELDFTKLDGSIYNTIVLAGENGSGKTTILVTLSSFLNLGSIEPFDYINYDVNDTRLTVMQMADVNQSRIGFHIRKNESSGLTETILSNEYNNLQLIEEDILDLRHYGFAYSKARSGFNTGEIKSTTTKQLDSGKYSDDSNGDFTSIKQLIVDIDSQDKSKWWEICERNKNNIITLDMFEKTSKISRFKNAFNEFFENLKFKKINNENPDEIKICFEKHGKEIYIDDLSTGEKQIVFRGTHLLKNINNMSGGIVLIDEPELSMHPRWQQKILKYYRKLFNNTQLIIATHSEYVLRSALEDKKNILVIVLNDDNGVIKSNKIVAPIVLPTITSAETNYLAFGINSTDYHIQLYGYLQNKINKFKVKDCDDYIICQPSYNSSIHYKQSSYGSTNYQSLPTYIRNSIDHPNPTNTFTDEELECSIKLLIDLCK